MAKKAKKAKKSKKAAMEATFHHRLASHPATIAMVARVGGCNLPPIKFLKQDDGSWLECFLKADCTYGNCVPIPANKVPVALK